MFCNFIDLEFLLVHENAEKKRDLANNNAFILAEQVWSLTHTYLFVVIFLLYRKIPKISPGAYIFQKAFLRGLFFEGLIFGGKFAFQNQLGLPYS